MFEEEPNENEKIELGIYNSFSSSIDFTCVLEMILFLTIITIIVIMVI